MRQVALHTKLNALRRSTFCMNPNTNGNDLFGNNSKHDFSFLFIHIEILVPIANFDYVSNIRNAESII